MSIQYFLGANAATGFYSLYSEVLSRQKNYLHIIKGGPGTGKSTYMRQIGQAAEARGLSVEYIPCSGDPDSLDGVVIPALGQGWIDGTAPHSLDSVQFGIDSDYVNLGRFCKTPLSCKKLDSANSVREMYQTSYRKAYAMLSAAASVAKAASVCGIKNHGDSSAFLQEIRDILRQRIHAQQTSHSDINHAEALPKVSVRHCFLSANSCQGHLVLHETLNKLCSLNYVIPNVSTSHPILLQIAGIGARLDQDMLLCHNPRNPESLDAVLFPTLSLSFLSAAYAPENANTLSLSLSCALPSSLEERDREGMLRHMEGKLMDTAYSLLAQAKAYHDEMERFYMEAMDFSALEAFTEESIAKLFP